MCEGAPAAPSVWPKQDLDDSSARGAAPLVAASACRSAPTSMGSPSGVPACQPRGLRDLALTSACRSRRQRGQRGGCGCQTATHILSSHLYALTERSIQKKILCESGMKQHIYCCPVPEPYVARGRRPSPQEITLSCRWIKVPIGCRKHEAGQAVAPVPCTLTVLKSAAPAAALASAARMSAAWAGPLGAVKALERPSCGRAHAPA